MLAAHRTRSSTAVFVAVARIGLGLLLLVMALAKLLDNRGFADIIATYALVPEPVLLPAALLVGLVELFLGLWLLGGWRTAEAALAALALHLGYFAFLAVALGRGLTVPNCGCFGVFWGRPLTLVSLAEDLLLAGVATLLWRGARRLRRRPATPG